LHKDFGLVAVQKTILKFVAEGNFILIYLQLNHKSVTKV